MKKVIFPVQLEPDLATIVSEASRKTNLSKSALIRAALRIGVPEMVKRMAKPKGTPLFNLEPWDAEALSRAYDKKHIDRDYPIAQMIAAQALPKV